MQGHRKERVFHLELPAPDINFFLNSREQGLPCWRSLFFPILEFCSSQTFDHYPIISLTM